MEYTTLPQINKKASRIGLGTWAVGGDLWGGSDEKDSIETIAKAIDKGITFIDTAPAYGNGTSETIVGKAIKSKDREKIIIATKVGLNQEQKNKVFRDSRRESLKKELVDSLRRLNVDYIDLYQIHWPDPKTPIEETAKTMREFIDKGLIVAAGVSNYSVEQIKEFKKYCPLCNLQPPYNLFEEEAERTLFPYCFKENIALVTYGALCRGLLSGTMNKDTKFKENDLRGGMDPKFKEPRFSQYIDCVHKLDEWSKRKYNKPVIALAVRWILDKGVNVALWGARKPDQLDAIQDVLGWKLTETDYKEIEKIIKDTVKDPIQPVFMAPPERE